MTAPIRAMPRTVSQNIPVGIGLMMLAVLLFSLNDTLGKWLAASYMAPQILLFRSIMAMVVLTAIIGRLGGFRAIINVERPRLQLVRALLGRIAPGLFYLIVRYPPR